MKFKYVKQLLFTFVLGAVCLTQAGKTYWVNINSPVQIAPYTNNWNEAAHSIQQVLPFVEDGDNVSITLKWEPSVEGRIYAVQWSTNLVSGFINRGGSAYPLDEITFSNDLPESFYKIKVSIED